MHCFHHIGGGSLGGGLKGSLGGGQSAGVGRMGLGQSLSQPSLGVASGPATALPGTSTFNLQLPPMGKRKNNFT